MIKVSVAEGTIRFLPIFCCHVCHREQAGTQARVEIMVWSFEDINSILEREELRSRDMPVGWSYNGKFKCGDCNGR